MLNTTTYQRLLFELSDDVVLFNEPVGEPLRAYDVLVDPIRVEAIDGGVLTVAPVLVLAGLAPAEPAVKGRLLLEVNSLHR